MWLWVVDGAVRVKLDRIMASDYYKQLQLVGAMELKVCRHRRVLLSYQRKIQYRRT